MKIDMIKFLSMFILVLFLFTTTAEAFNSFEDLTASPSISANDADLDLVNPDMIFISVVPEPLFWFRKQSQVIVQAYIPEVATLVSIILSPNLISRAPPVSFS